MLVTQRRSWKSLPQDPALKCLTHVHIHAHMSAPGYEVRGDAKDRRTEGSLGSAEGDESEELQLMTEERRSETEGPVWICRESIGANKAVVSGRALW